MRVQKYKKEESEEVNNIDNYVLRAKQEREEKENRASRNKALNRSRRWIGLRLGIIVGLCFGITAEMVNVYLLPDLWFFSPPFGALGNVVFYGFFIAFISWLLSIPDDTFTGVSLGCLAGLAAFEIRSWLIPGASSIIRMLFDPTLLMFALVSLAFIGLLLIPVMLLWRTSVENLYEKQAISWWNWEKLKFPIGFLLLSILAGSFLIISSDNRAILRNMKNLIDDGLSAVSENQLPEPLNTRSTKWLLDYEGQDFYLELSPDLNTEKKSAFKSILGQTSLGGYISVAAHFKGGRTIICTYQSSRIRPYCH